MLKELKKLYYSAPFLLDTNFFSPQFQPDPQIFSPTRPDPQGFLVNPTRPDPYLLQPDPTRPAKFQARGITISCLF